MSDIKVKVDNFDEAVAKALKETRDLTFEGLKRAVDKTAKDTIRKIRGKAPKRTGTYAKGWASKATSGNSSARYGKTVYNKDRYPLAHLLEHGHEIRGYLAARTTKTRTRAFHHIPSDGETEKLLEQNLESEVGSG